MSMNQMDLNIKNKFDYIYKSMLWGGNLDDPETGGGSGGGSRIPITKTCRNILYNIIKKYNIKSLVDAPCGSFAWMPLLLKNITNEISDFKYYGVDVVESIINSSKMKYSNRTNWKFDVLDITSHKLPSGYDLIFSRDALQHLPLIKVADALKMISISNDSKYFLVGSYVKNGKNTNIRIGDYFSIDLTKYPFNLNNYIDIFAEMTFDQKHLVLYDIQNYLRNVDFNLIYSNIKKMTEKKLAN